MITLGVTLGDVTGIGPEVALKAASHGDFGDVALVLVGDSETIQSEAVRYGVTQPIQPWQQAVSGPGLWRLDPGDSVLPRGLKAGAPEASRAAVASLREGARRCLQGEWQGLVTAPVSKEAIQRSGIPFVGQTEFLSELAGTTRTAMMLLGTDDRGRWLRVALATTHLPLKAVPASLTVDGIEQVIRLTSEACGDLGLNQRRVAVCGLNPHAGEGGLMGTEELDIIRPAIEGARLAGSDVSGPWAADTVFYQALRGDYDAVVAMYHDQGLGPLKLVAFDTGVNWTLGLPFVRTSPDHGTAYNIAGTGTARPDSMTAAIRLAVTLASRAR
jgi:4-hydroxythreonine-4-phosphate dehydrogenase